MKSKVVLLSGATGFIGSHLVEALIKHGYTVIALRRQNSDMSKLGVRYSAIWWYDIKCGIEQAFVDHKIDYIIHLATNYGRGADSVVELLTINLLLPCKLMELAEQNQIKLFVNTDSFYCKAKAKNCILLPQYVLSKKNVISWAKLILRKVRFVNMRLEHVYGPADSKYKFVSYVMDQIKAGQAEIALTSCEVRRDFIYVKDVVEAYLTILTGYEKLPGFSCVEVGTGIDCKVRHFLNEMSALLGSSIRFDFGGLPDRQGEMEYSVAENSILRSLGWRAKYGIKAGLKEMLKLELGV